MINFENASILGYSHRSEFVGNYNFRTVKNLSVQGYILDLTNTSGVSGVWSGMADFIFSGQDNQAIYLNNINYGNGKILSLNFSNNNDVQYKSYTANLEIYTSGNLFNLTSDLGGLSGISFIPIHSFSETFNFKTLDNGGTGYSHSVSIVVDNLNNNPSVLAKVLAQALYDGTNITGVLGSYNFSGIKKYYREIYDIVNNKFDFEEEAEFINSGSGFSWEYTHNVTQSENGVVNVSEEGKIKGIVVPVEDSMTSGINYVTQTVYDRCNEVFGVYVPTGGYGLDTQYIFKEFSITAFEGIADYRFTYTNNPRLQSGYFWEKTIKIDRAENDIYSVSEAGTIQGLGRKLINQYENALSGWGVVKTGISGRCEAAYTVERDLDSDLYLIRTSESRSKYEGNVTYTYVYSDNPSSSGVSGINQVTISVTDTMPVSINNRFNIMNEKEIIQWIDIATVGNRNITINLVGDRNVSKSTFLDKAKIEANTWKPGASLGDDIYLNECKYTLNYPENSFSFNCGFNFHADKAFEDYLV